MVFLFLFFFLFFFFLFRFRCQTKDVLSYPLPPLFFGRGVKEIEMRKQETLNGDVVTFSRTPPTSLFMPVPTLHSSIHIFFIWRFLRSRNASLRYQLLNNQSNDPRAFFSFLFHLFCLRFFFFLSFLFLFFRLHRPTACSPLSSFSRLPLHHASAFTISIFFPFSSLYSSLLLIYTSLRLQLVLHFFLLSLDLLLSRFFSRVLPDLLASFSRNVSFLLPISNRSLDFFFLRFLLLVRFSYVLLRSTFLLQSTIFHSLSFSFSSRIYIYVSPFDLLDFSSLPSTCSFPCQSPLVFSALSLAPF